MNFRHMGSSHPCGYIKRQGFTSPYLVSLALGIGQLATARSRFLNSEQSSLRGLVCLVSGLFSNQSENKRPLCFRFLKV